MSEITKKKPSLYFTKTSTSEVESVHSQLDRLNQALIAFNLEKNSSISEYPDSRPSVDSVPDFEKQSLPEIEFERLKSSCFERSQMVNEDFRSHEQRKSPKVVPVKRLVLKLNEDELVNLSNDIISAKSRTEGPSEIIFNSKNRQLVIVVRDEIRFPNKEILKNFSEEQRKKPESMACSDLDIYMSRAYLDTFPEHTKTIKKSPSFVSSTDHKKSEVKQKELQKMIEKIDWQISEANLAQQLYCTKSNTLKVLEKKIKEKQRDLLIEENKLNTQKILMKKDLEILSQQKISNSKLFEENSKKKELIQKVLKDLKSTSITPTPLEKTETIVLKPIRGDIDSDIKQLESDIKVLENQLNSDEDSSNLIRTKLDRLKTKLNSLRSRRVINASIDRSNSVSRHRSVDRKLCGKSLGVCYKTDAKSEPLVSNNKINTGKNMEKENENFEELDKYIKLRETWLNEKEEELSKRENMLINTWGKCPESLGLVSIVQSEYRNLKILRNDLEKKQKVFEKQILEISRKSSELKAKEQKIKERFESFDWFFLEKKKVEASLYMLLTVFDSA